MLELFKSVISKDVFKKIAPEIMSVAAAFVFFISGVNIAYSAVLFVEQEQQEEMIVSSLLAEPNPLFLEKLTENNTINDEYWDNMQPVPEYLAEKEAAEQKAREEAERKEREAKEAAEQKAREEKAAAAKKAENNPPTSPKNDTRSGVLSKSEVRQLLENACDKYGVTGSDRTWIIEMGLNISWKESRWNPSAQNKSSSASGLFQFLKAWGPLENRLDPVWSANRFVKVFVDGGKSKIYQHWRSVL